MEADDAWSAEIKRLPLAPDPDPLALDDDLADRLLDGDLSLDQAPAGYAEVAALLAAAAAPPSPAELAGQEAVLAELRAATRARRTVPRATGRPGRRRRVGLLVAVAVGALSITGIAAATGTLPDPIRDTARRILATVDDTASMPSITPGRQPAPSTGEGATVGATSEGQRPRPAGEPGATAGPAEVNDDPCRASKVGKGADRSKKPNAVTSQAPVEAADDADNATSQCHKSQPDGSGGNGQRKHPPSDGHGRGQGELPPDAGSKPGQGRAGPPPNGGGGSSEIGRPPETGPHRTQLSTSR